MQSEIKTFTYPNGDIQRVQLLRWDDWSGLNFFQPNPAENALDSFFHIYRTFLVPACPWLFGHLVLMRLPEDLETQVTHQTGRFGDVADPLTAAAAVLQQEMRIRGEKPVFFSETAEKLWRELERKSCLRIVSGKLPVTTVIPVANRAGYLTRCGETAAMKVNANFFIMDRFDCATIYDHVGTPFGLCVKEGVVENPPLFGREALLVRKDGNVSVEAPDIRKLELEIGGQVYVHGKNCRIFTRPERLRSPGGKGTKLVIIGCRVAAVCREGSVGIPASGIVLCPEGDCAVQPGAKVVYRGMEDVRFGIQVGNSILKNGVETKGFISRFYNIRRLERVPFPPSLYPMDFEKARAARIALGADSDGKPMLLWAEGAAKLGYTPGKDSCGASLAEMGRICREMGMVNAVNLDGGGSAQILLGNRRSLMISDRNKQDFSEAERPVPLGLMLE